VLASIRTDLDAFSDLESDTLMLSGYRMMQEEFQNCIQGFPVTSGAPVDWRFLQVDRFASALAGSPEFEEFKRTLEVARATTFKPYRLSKAVKLVTWITAAAALVGMILLALSVRGYSVSIDRLLAAVVVLAAAALGAKVILHRLLRNPNPLWQIVLAVPLLVIGGPLIWISTTFLDPIYLRSGPRYRK
jgi:hypothetical protein